MGFMNMCASFADIIRSAEKRCLLRWLLVALLPLVSVGTRAAATLWSADNLQMVHLQDRNRYVCDPDEVLSQAMRDSADYYLRRLHVDCGIQTVFVVVRHVKDGDTFRMAQDLGNRYGVGTKKDRRGLVVVVSVNDCRYTIAPGMGLEADLTDVECDDIARACIVKNMKANRIDEMAVETVKTLYRKFKTGDTGLSSANDDEETATDDDWLTAIVVSLLFLGWPLWLLIRAVLVRLGLMKKPPQKTNRNKRNRHHDDWMPPFFFGGGGGFGGSGGSSGGSFGGGSFGGGGSSGGW